MEVLCVGPPRSGTESLQHALLKLGYDYTYHGWDIVFDQPAPAQEWAKLARRKFCPMDNIDGDCEITAADFDRLIGHCVAVTDAPSSVFASEMIRAYPEAKVVLNIRRDPDKWHQSAMKHLVTANNNWLIYFTSFFSKELFWVWHAYHRILWNGLFRCIDGNHYAGIGKNGKWIYREHCDMIRGMVAKERLLEWSVEDGWEPLCKFLGKEVPDEPFPWTNDAAGFEVRASKAIKKWFLGALLNFVILVSALVLVIAVVWRFK